MKKLLLIVILFLINYDLSAIIVKGKVAWADGSVTEVANIDIPTVKFESLILYTILQKSVKIERDGVYKRYSPDDVKYFIFKYEGVERKMVSIPKSFNAYWRFQIKKPKKRVFALLIVDGPMKGYKYYEKLWYELQHYQDPNYILQKQDGLPHIMKFLFFKPDTHRFVKDCEAAKKYVKSRETLRQNPLDLARYYNEHCN